MECPKCKTQMEKGVLSTHGATWLDRQPKEPFASIWRFTTGGGKIVTAWRCPNCFNIELQSEK